jgi:hypothetical protein
MDTSVINFIKDSRNLLGLEVILGLDKLNEEEIQIFEIDAKNISALSFEDAILFLINRQLPTHLALAHLTLICIRYDLIPPTITRINQKILVFEWPLSIDRTLSVEMFPDALCLTYSMENVDKVFLINGEVRCCTCAKSSTDIYEDYQQGIDSLHSELVRYYLIKKKLNINQIFQEK